MFVENNDEQRRGWFLSYSVRLWRGRIGTVALPLVDFLQRSSHQRCLVVLGQAFGVAERRDALLIGQHADRPRPVGAPHATIEPERIDDPQYRLLSSYGNGWCDIVQAPLIFTLTFSY